LHLTFALLVHWLGRRSRLLIEHFLGWFDQEVLEQLLLVKGVKQNLVFLLFTADLHLLLVVVVLE